MPVTIGGSPISPAQAAELRAAFGITEPTPITETKTILVGADQTVIFDSEDGGAAKLASLAAVSTYTGGAPSATAPAAFTAGQWTATAGNGQVVLNITALPADGGSSITALQYRIGSGSAVNLTGTGTGERTITGLTNGVAVDIQIRAVNAIGAAAWSDVKTRTPVSSSGGLSIVQSPTRTVEPYTLTIQQPLTAVGSGNHLLMTLIAVTAAGVPTWSDSEGGTPTPTLLYSYVADSHTHRFYSLANVTNGATWIRATFSSDTEAYLKVTEVAGSTPALAGSGNGESQSTASQWDHAFTSAVDDSVFLGCASFTNGTTTTGISPVTADCTAEWHANSVGLFPTAGANTASFTLPDGRSGHKSWAVVRAS